MIWEFIVGLIILTLGSEALLRGAAGVKRRFGVPDFIIGLVIVGFGTSLPELVIGFGAASVGAEELALGMVMGSNIFNLLGVLGLAALIAPLATDERALKRDGLFMAAAALSLAALSMTGRLDRWGGLLLLAGLAVYIATVFIDEKRLPVGRVSLYRAKADFARHGPRAPWLAGLFLLAGGLLVTLGAGWVIEATVGLAFDLGVGEDVLGLTLVAIATSLPEFLVSIIAAQRRQYGVACGSILGSNIFNIFGVGGLIALVFPAVFPTRLAGPDMAVLVGVSLIILIALATGRRLSRGEGGLALAAYAVYGLWRTGAFV
ncbi:MAG: calcium/sodium antiporter [Pseudomonadota bacterium]